SSTSSPRKLPKFEASKPQHKLESSSGGWGLSVRRVAVMLVLVLELHQLKLQTVLSLGELVLKVDQLAVVSLGLDLLGEFLDGGLLVLDHGNLMGALGSFELLDLLIGTLHQGLGLGEKVRLEVSLDK